MEKSNSLPELSETSKSVGMNGNFEGESRSEDKEGTRSRTLTNKGEAYIVNKAHQERTSAGAALRKKITHINHLLEQSNEISFLERLRNDLDSLRETYQIYYSKLVDPQQINEAYQWFDVRDREHFQCRTKINEVIKAQELATISDRVSKKSLRSKSSHSSRSSSLSVRSKIARAAVEGSFTSNRNGFYWSRSRV